jgi:tripartite ATP-independent transporter DctM subunit
MGISVYWTSKKRGYPVEKKASLKERLISFWRAIPSLMTVVIIVGGIWGGIFTPTEAAVVASLYALILGTVVYKELKLKDVMDVLKNSLLQSCKTLFIIAVANFLSYFLIHQRIPNMIINGMTSITDNKYILILIIIFVLLVLGCFVEGTAVILIVTPIFMPIINQIGMDPVQFGVVMILASMIGLLTPPVGMSLYAVSSICDVDIIRLSKAVIPYLIGIFIVLLLFAFCEPLAMFLPRLLM